MQFLKLAVILSSCFILTAQDLFALPIGFGRNLRELNYSVMKTDHFWTYYDERIPREAQAITQALEKARPTFERWFDIKRSDPLPVIMSSMTANASFANFLTDAIELQTLGEGDRDLAWHEFTHNIMYVYLENIFGPAGSILHLPWLPAWWLEGLAEATSHSIGSDLMYSIERAKAREGNWPSYDKLHSLYDSRFAREGYAISGAFVSYILRTYGAEKLGKIMSDFYDYTMPWYWLQTLIPFVDNMPFDLALLAHTGKSGPELWEEYKEKAENYWRAQDDYVLIRKHSYQPQISEYKPPRKTGHMAAAEARVTSTGGFHARGNYLYDFALSDGSIYVRERSAGTANQSEIFKERLLQKVPDEITRAAVLYGSTQLVVKSDLNDNLGFISTIFRLDGKKLLAKLKRNARILKLLAGQNEIFWLESKLGVARLCMAPKKVFHTKGRIPNSAIKCLPSSGYPSKLSYLGEHFVTEKKEEFAEKIWLGLSVDKITGTKHQILEFNTKSKKLSKVFSKAQGKPISVVKAGNHRYVLSSDFKNRSIRKYSDTGSCLGQLKLSDVAEQLYGFDDGALGVYLAEYTQEAARIEETIFYLLRFDPERKNFQKCSNTGEPGSPLLYALNHSGSSFTKSLLANDPWTKTIPNYQNTEEPPALDQLKPQYESKKSDWHPRPVFVFPWIGAAADGNQFGFVSVPIMDHLQNETISLTALIGPESRYPSLDLNFVSNRYAATLRATLFRRQTWNGSFARSFFFFDERGMELEASRFFLDHNIAMSGGMRFSDKKPFIGDDEIWALVAKGYAAEFYGNYSQSFISNRSGRPSFSYGASTTVVPEALNDNFQYNRLNFRTSVGYSFYILDMNTRQRLGLTYGRTRGKRRPLLREVYRPLRTFIPGSGTGFNAINVGIIGPGLLTAGDNGDTQARLNWSWTFPIVRHLNQLIHIFYLERLDFTAFVNYGRAWEHNIAPKLDSFIGAHGYNLDLQSDIKGVSVNVGLGTGQVFDEDWEVFFKFGFDTLIN